MQPLFIRSHSGALFCLYYSPVNKPVDRAILHVQAFGEEMNKSRRMVALQARDLANQGYAILVLDLFGTGESSGEFSEATWDIWLDNIHTAIEWLREHGAHSVALWGLRTGNLLAMDFMSRDRQKIDRLLCWQPVLNGDSFITQFLRLRVTAAIMNGNAPKEKTSDLKQQLQEGRGIEVAGYWLNPDLIRPLMALRAETLPCSLKRSAIFEVVANEETPLSTSNSHFCSKLRANNIETSLTKVVGEGFWCSQEITMVPDLISCTNQEVDTWL